MFRGRENATIIGPDFGFAHGERSAPVARLHTPSDHAAGDAEIRSGGQKVAVISPDLGLSLIHGGSEVDGVSRAQKDTGWKTAYQEADSSQQPLGNRYECPNTGVDVFQEYPEKFVRLSCTENAFAHVAVKNAGHLRDRQDG